MTELKEKAIRLGINTNKAKKVDLIRSIQIKEGNRPCFLTKHRDCDQIDCCWRDDCLD